MVRITKWWLALVVAVVALAVFVDGYSYVYRYAVVHVPIGRPLPHNRPPTLFGDQLYFHKGLDLQGGTQLTIAICQGANTPAGIGCRVGLPKGKTLAQAQAATLTILERRVNALGVSGAQVQAQGTDQVLVTLPGVDVNQALGTLGTTAQLHFATAVPGAPSVNGNPTQGIPCTTQTCIDQNQLVDPTCFPPQHPSSACQFNNPADYPVSATGLRYHWKIDPRITASDLSTASVGQTTTGSDAVNLTFDSAGANEWLRLTTAACTHNPDCTLSGVGGACPAAVPPLAQVAIFLDGQVLTAPCVESPSSNQTQITGNFTFNSAQQLVNELNAGALPAQIAPAQVTTVSATLGKQSVQRSLVAGAFGMLLVILFMLLYYRFPGVLASLALLGYGSIVLAVFKLVPVTLDLPGLAAFVLSVGMAVDANVLIFERMKEELRQGRSIGLATEQGFKRAWPAIRDSNISTSITCAVLYFFGAPQVKGFALTLFIGVAASMFSSIIITHTILHYAQRWFAFARNPRLYTRLLPSDRLAQAMAPGRRFDIVSHRNLFFGASLAVIVPGLLTILIAGFNLGIDFTGGDQVTARLLHGASIPRVLSVVREVVPTAQPQVLAASGHSYVVQTLPVPAAEVALIVHALDRHFGIPHDSAGNPVVNETTVGPTIAAGLVVSSVVLVIVASLLIAGYLAFRFSQSTIQARRFAICALTALLHDVFVLAGVWAILGHFSQLGTVNTLFVTALLTVVGFSVHDTIVVFDRIRENLRVVGTRMSFEQIVNLSVVQTLARSLNTSLTVLFVLLALFLFGGTTTQGFVLALLIGIASGTYSSIFNASTLLTAWRQLDRRQPARGGAPGRALPAAARDA
ncbi:MAG TPA: protein translocase subunit SecD [Verrucomicrobiae bacterium]|nr:protein translocase subunit SecD [Verrucomicrobiae bacterium]